MFPSLICPPFLTIICVVNLQCVSMVKENYYEVVEIFMLSGTNVDTSRLGYGLHYHLSCPKKKGLSLYSTSTLSFFPLCFPSPLHLLSTPYSLFLCPLLVQSSPPQQHCQWGLQQ